MMVAFDAVGVVSRFVFTVRTGDEVRRSNTGLASRQIRKENVFRLAVLAGIQQIPLSGGKSAHVFNDSPLFGIVQKTFRGNGFQYLCL